MALTSSGNTATPPDFPPLKDWIDAGSGRTEEGIGWRRATGVVGCPAAILMQEAGVKGEPLEARTLRVFDTGHRTEAQIVAALARSGNPLMGGKHHDAPPTVLTGGDGDFQEECQITVGADPYSITVPGHLDGRLTWKGQEFIVDVKSMSDFAFDRLEKGEVDDKYLDQFNLYMRGTNTQWCACIGVRKETSHVTISWVPRDEERLTDIDNRVADILANVGNPGMIAELGWCVSKKEMVYQRKKPVGYIPTGREEARQKHEDGMPATYCSYASVCPKVGKGGFEFVIDGGKPKWIRGTVSKEK